MKASNLEKKFHWLALAHQLKPTREYRFHPDRRWRFDFAWPAVKVAVEIEGGSWVRGGHNRGVGYQKDCEKYNAATALGWRVFRLTGAMINAQALTQIKSLIYEEAQATKGTV